MVFSDNQYQNETYTFKDMLRQDYCQQFIYAIMVEVNSYEDREHWNLMKRKEVPMGHYVNGRLSTILDISSFKRNIFIWKTPEAQIKTVYPWRNAKISYQLLVDLLSISKLDYCPSPACNNQNSQAEVAVHLFCSGISTG